MSLKAKIEAVIYASEEPVTLPQLIGLLGEEAQAELDALAAQQQQLALDEVEIGPSNDADALNAEVIVISEEIELDETEGEASEEEAVAEATEEAAAANEESAEEPSGPEEEQQPEPLTAAPDSSETVAAEASLEPTEGPASETAPESDPETAAKESAAAQKARDRALRLYFRAIVDELIADYANNDRGLEIREVAGGFRMATRPEYHDAVRGFVKSLKPPLKLSLQALETLAVIAYKQPVTAPEISEIRGVDSGGVLGSLIARKLITTAGRKQVIGRPILYKTTKDFLVRFGLKDLNELPSIEEFEKMAGELADLEPSQEEIPMEADPRNESIEDAGPQGTPTSLNESDAASEPAQALHESVEDVLSDDSTRPEGHEREHADPSEVEPMAEVHEAQADGNPNSDEPPSINEDEGDEEATAEQEILERRNDPDVPGNESQHATEDNDPAADNKRADDEPEPDPAEDAIVDGRISGPPPDYSADETEDPSAIEAEIQANEKIGGA